MKAKIEQEHGHAVAAQKVIYSGTHHIALCSEKSTEHLREGKILSDDKTIESCGIKEKDFLVLMVSKVLLLIPLKTLRK